MTHPSHVAAQLTAYSITHAASAATAWATALRHLDPEGLRAIAATMPDDAMGQSLKAQLRTLARHLEASPLNLGAK